MTRVRYKKRRGRRIGIFQFKVRPLASELDEIVKYCQMFEGWILSLLLDTTFVENDSLKCASHMSEVKNLRRVSSGPGSFKNNLVVELHFIILNRISVSMNLLLNFNVTLIKLLKP